MVIVRFGLFFLPPDMVVLEPRMSIRLLIVDDHELVRNGLKAMVAGTEIAVV
jgi:hypothetical protein